MDSKAVVDYVDIANNEITDIPSVISISTMCASCKLTSAIDINYIKEHMKLDINDIIKIDSDNNTLLVKKNKKNKSRKFTINKRCVFFNQVTMLIRITTGETLDLNLEPKINLKLFKNGSIQMSGCKSVESINIVLNKLINRLKKENTMNNILENSNVSVEKFKIDMINTNYKMDIKIDRPKLYELLLKKKIKTIYEPCIRACVIIKHTPDTNNENDKEISIFIFQKGNIIITGAKSKAHIISTYEYVNKLVSDHAYSICKRNEKEEEKLILQIYESIKKDIKNGLIEI